MDTWRNLTVPSKLQEIRTVWLQGALSLEFLVGGHRMGACMWAMVGVRRAMGQRGSDSSTIPSHRSSFHLPTLSILQEIG